MGTARKTCTVWMIAALAAVCASVRAEDLVRIPMVFHVAHEEGTPVAPASFIAEQLATANEIFRPLGLELVENTQRPLASRHAKLVTRAQRDALARYVKKGAIHCFVVVKLMDVDEPGRERRGVHWHPRRAPHRSYVIISKISGPYVLAHELGHFFGNPQHSDVPGNLMSYERTDAPPFLDATQVEHIRTTLASLLQTGALMPLARTAAETSARLAD